MMELALSLGETQKPFSFLDKSNNMVNKDLGFYMGLGRSKERGETLEGERRRDCSDPPPVQLDLLPFSPVPRGQPPSQLRFPWLTENLMSEPGRGLDVYRKHTAAAAEETEEGVAAAPSSSPNSTVCSFRLEFGSMYGSGRSKRDLEASGNEIVENERGSSRGSEEEEDNGGLARKKLRLTKDQSAFLEDSFKEHNTLNPKQKQALAKKLNLRPRQVEVWFQNRRARTKLKQTEVDCEYLKRCCETLTEENRRLQKELQELRALKTSHPFYKQLPATTLTMCPSCERVAATTTSSAAAATTTTTTISTNVKEGLAKPRLHPFLHATPAAKVLH